jgi:hypothetical protein
MAKSAHHVLYPQVLRAEAPALGRPETGVALKITDMPSSVHDGHALVDVFSEVALLESFAQSPAVCQVNYRRRQACYLAVNWSWMMPDSSSTLVHNGHEALRQFAASHAVWGCCSCGTTGWRVTASCWCCGDTNAAWPSGGRPCQWTRRLTCGCTCLSSAMCCVLCRCA